MPCLLFHVQVTTYEGLTWVFDTDMVLHKEGIFLPGLRGRQLVTL